MDNFKSKITRPFRQSRTAKVAGIAAAIVVVVAGVFVARSMGAGYFSSTEAESATLTAAATVVTDSTASGGKAVEFKAATTPPPTIPPVIPPTTTPQPSTGWPQANNTGYPHGLPGDTRTPVTLTDYNCGHDSKGNILPLKITTPMTIDSRIIRCPITITSPGVVIKNSFINVEDAMAITVDADNANTLIQDTEVSGLDGNGRPTDTSTGGISLIGWGSYRLIRVNGHGSGDILRPNGSAQVLDSWLHDPGCLGGECHNDTIQVTSADCNMSTQSYLASNNQRYCLDFEHNSLQNPSQQTSNILIKADQGNIHDVYVNNNLFNGGGYSFYWYDAGFRSTNGTVVNNHFMRSPEAGGVFAKGGYWGPVAINAAQNPIIWTNNVWDDTNAQIGL